jgi:hypothetical protein
MGSGPWCDRCAARSPRPEAFHADSNVQWVAPPAIPMVGFGAARVGRTAVMLALGTVCSFLVEFFLRRV